MNFASRAITPQQNTGGAQIKGVLKIKGVRIPLEIH